MIGGMVLGIGKGSRAGLVKGKGNRSGDNGGYGSFLIWNCVPFVLCFLLFVKDNNLFGEDC